MGAANSPIRALGLTIVLLGFGFVGMAGIVAADGGPIVKERYVAGLSTAQNLPVQQQTVVCTEEANVGGICEASVPTETNLVVLVDDQALGRVPFHWQALNADGQAADCPHGHSIGEDTMHLPPGCPLVDVYISAPATEGTIVIKEGDVVII